MPHSATGVAFTIPDTLRNWPWPRHLNPHYDICKAESSAWCEGFKAFSPNAQKAFNRCDFNLLACHVWPLLNKDGARIGCDLMNLFFIIDEHSDVVDGPGARSQVDIIMNALQNPYKPRPQGEWIVGEITRQFWLNVIKTATPSSQRRFIRTFGECMNAVVQEAKDRTEHYIRNIESYFQVRRGTIGAKPCFAIIEVYLNIPDEVFEDPTIQTLTETAIDMIIICNDLCSYNVEQARDDDKHNLVTVVMNEKQIGLHEALDWISELHDSLVEEFLRAYKRLPLALLDREIATYVDGLGKFVRGKDCWCFESERYFDKHGLEIQKSRVVQLIPKGNAGNTGLVPKVAMLDLHQAKID